MFNWQRTLFTKFLNLENWILWLAEIHISLMSSTNITFLKLQMGLKRLAIYFKSFTANLFCCLRSVPTGLVIAIKWIMCVQEKIELSSIFTKTKVKLNQNFRRSLLNYKDKATIKNCIKSSQGLQQAGILLPGVGHPHLTPWLRTWFCI